MSVYRPRHKDGSPRSPFYQYDFVVRGVRFCGSTGETEERKAKATERRLKAEATQEIANRVHRDQTEIAVVFGRFWEEVAQHDKAADTTLYRMERLRAELTAMLGQRGRPALIGEVTDDLLAAYVARRRGQPSRTGHLPSPATINREVQVLRRILRRAALVWRLPITIPNWGALLHAEPEERVIEVSRSEEDRLLDAMRPDFRPALRFLLLAGLRSGSLFPLHPSAVDFENRILTLRLKSKAPGGRVQILPITTQMLVVLGNEIGKHRDAVFTFLPQRTRDGRQRGVPHPIDQGTFRNAFKAAAAAIGHPDLRVHDLRHTAGTRTLRATGNLRAVQHQLGHTRIL